MADFEINVKINGVEQTVKTISQLETAIQQTQAELTGLQSGTREFKSLENQSKNLENIFKALNEDVSGFTKNVTKSAGATKKMASAIQDTAEATQNLSSEPIKQVASETEKFTSKANSARAELRKITQELYNLEPGSARFQELSLRAGELRDQMGDTSAIIGVVAGNAAERFGGSLELALTQGIVGLQGLQQGFQAAGIENEKLNKTLQILQGVLGAASLIKFAGALPDTIDQIKAGFASVVGPAKAYISSLFTTTTATEGATVATRALAIAQKALPWIAVAAAVVTVGVAIYDYVQSSNQAAKSEEKRKKELEELNKLQKEQADFVSKETIEFYKQIAALKETTKGSKERKKTIDDINEQYGTTLKNLQDEDQFQKQVNATVIQYIAFQRLRFKEQKNAEKLQASLAKEEELTQKLTEAKKEEEKARKRLEALGQFRAPADAPLKGASGEREGDLQRQTNQVSLLTIQLDKAKQTTESLGSSQTALAEEIEKLGFKTEDSGKKVVKSVNNQKDAYDQLTQRLLEWNKQVSDSEKALENSRRTQDRSEVERQSIQLDLSLANVITKYETDKKFIEENIKDKVKANEALLKLEEAKQNVTINLAKATLGEIKKLNEQQVEQDQFLLQQLKLGREILNKEFTFGNQNTNDLILSQQNELLNAQLSSIEAHIENTSALEINEQNRLATERLKIRKQLAQNELDIALQATETEKVLQRTEILKYYDDLKQIQVSFNEETGKAQVEIDRQGLAQRLIDIEDEVDKEAKIRKEAGDNSFDIATELQKRALAEKQRFNKLVIDAEAFLNKQIENLNLESNLKIQTAEEEFAQKTIDLADKRGQAVREITLENVLAFVEEVNQIASQSFGVISDLINEIDNIRQTDQELLNQQNEQQLQALQQRYEKEKALETDRYQKGLITKEAYNQSILALDNQLKIGSDNLNNELVAQQNAVAEKTFKTQKALRISNTIISGIQGALDAYASAQSLPFGAGAIVGPILAAAVAATTAIAVRNIAKTKFSPAGGASNATTSFSSQSANIPQIGGGSQFGQSGGFTSFNTQNIGTPQQQSTQTENPPTQTEQRVYVVESDITSTQRRVRVLEGQSTFN